METSASLDTHQHSQRGGDGLLHPNDLDQEEEEEVDDLRDSTSDSDGTDESDDPCDIIEEGLAETMRAQEDPTCAAGQPVGVLRGTVSYKPRAISWCAHANGDPRRTVAYKPRAAPRFPHGHNKQRSTVP